MWKYRCFRDVILQTSLGSYLRKWCDLLFMIKYTHKYISHAHDIFWTHKPINSKFLLKTVLYIGFSQICFIYNKLIICNFGQDSTLFWTVSKDDETKLCCMNLSRSETETSVVPLWGSQKFLSWSQKIKLQISSIKFFYCQVHTRCRLGTEILGTRQRKQPGITYKY